MSSMYDKKILKAIGFYEVEAKPTASKEELQALSVPFSLWTVDESTMQPKRLKVIRYGVLEGIGSTEPSITVQYFSRTAVMRPEGFWLRKEDVLEHIKFLDYCVFIDKCFKDFEVFCLRNFVESMEKKVDGYEVKVKGCTAQEGTLREAVFAACLKAEVLSYKVAMAALTGEPLEDKSPDGLRNFVVLFDSYELNGCSYSLGFQADAEDEEHAKEQCLNAHEDADIFYVWEGPKGVGIGPAMDAYQESRKGGSNVNV